VAISRHGRRKRIPTMRLRRWPVSRGSKRLPFPTLYDRVATGGEGRTTALCTPDLSCFGLRPGRLGLSGHRSMAGGPANNIPGHPVSDLRQAASPAGAAKPVSRNTGPRDAWIAVSNGPPARSRIGYAEAGAALHAGFETPTTPIYPLSEIFRRFVRADLNLTPLGGTGAVAICSTD